VDAPPVGRSAAGARLLQAHPADVNLAIAQAGSDTPSTFAQYNNLDATILLDQNGERPFPPKLRLLSHWNLRDEIRRLRG